jgi:hypothetical protein
MNENDIVELHLSGRQAHDLIALMLGLGTLTNLELDELVDAGVPGAIRVWTFDRGDLFDTFAAMQDMLIPSMIQE